MSTEQPSQSASALPKGCRVLITGATGFTGSALLRRCVEQGLSVRAIARPSSKRPDMPEGSVEWITGQVYDKEVIQQAMDGVQIVFHVAAAYREAGIANETYYRVHVESTALLAEAALRQPDFLRFVHVSTVGVHGHIEHPPANENTPFQPSDIYQRTKAEAERGLHAFAKEHALPYTVIRPAAIYGPGDRRLLKVFRMARAPVFPLLGRGLCLYHLIHVDDLVNGLYRAAWHPKALGEVFICGDPQAVSLEWMGRVIASELHRRFRPIRLPATPFFLLADLTEAICKPFGWTPPIYRRRVAFFTKDRAFDTSKIQQRLGLTYQWTTEAGLRATARWYKEKGWL